MWEHLTEEEASRAAINCFHYLKSGGHSGRLYVPDGFQPSFDYINAVKPGARRQVLKTIKSSIHIQPFQKSLNLSVSR